MGITDGRQITALSHGEHFLNHHSFCFSNQKTCEDSAVSVCTRPLFQSPLGLTTFRPAFYCRFFFFSFVCAQFPAMRALFTAQEQAIDAARDTALVRADVRYMHCTGV
jgi:hypothetical protein